MKSEVQRIANNPRGLLGIMTDYFHRDLDPTLISALEEMPVVVITGMRQTGKTTFLSKEPGLSKRRYVTFDDFPQLAAAQSDPEQFVSSEEPMTIDKKKIIVTPG